MTRDQLKQRYRDLGLRAYQVAKLCGVTPSAENRWCSTATRGAVLPIGADNLLAAMEAMTPEQLARYLADRGIA